MKQTAIRAARLAGKNIIKTFRKLKGEKIVNYKKHREIVTQADLDSNKIIIKEINKKFPNHNILSEESGLTDMGSDYLWIIDPLDGTNNFQAGIPFFSICIALVFKREIVLGVVYVPLLDELYLAEKGKGAYFNGKRIKVSNVNKLSNSLILFCHGYALRNAKKDIRYFSKIEPRARLTRRLGSAGVELASVASGRAEAIIITGVRAWDAAAGSLIVREAGGKVTDFNNKDWTLDSKDIVATNGKIHNQIIRFLK